MAPCVATPSWRPLLGAAIASAVLAGCIVGPDFHAPRAPASTRFTEAPLPARTAAAAISGGEAQHLTAESDIPGEWWELFRSPQISALVTRALKANPDVAAAQATLLQARETTRAEVGALFPSVGVSAGVTRQQQSLVGFGFGSGSVTDTVYNGGLNVSYTLDAFGGVRRQVEQLGAQAEFQRFQLEAEDLTIAANVSVDTSAGGSVLS